MSSIRNCEITGYGTYLADTKVQFEDQTRYRVSPETSHLGMLTYAGQLALKSAGLEPNDLDCIISASAIGVQPIPCTAALIQEQLAPDARAAAFDINSTCTSFITAVDIASGLISSGRFKNILITSGDVGSRGLNPNQQESYELFSDAAASIVLSQTNSKDKGVIASDIRTWPQYAHDTEIRGGLTNMQPQYYADNPEEFMFDMDGRATLRGIMKTLPPFFAEFHEKNELSVDDYKVIIPHQASRALNLAMRILGVPDDKFVNMVNDYGNMVSASVPYALCKQFDEGAVAEGDRVLLCGTAAGLTANILAIQL